MEVALKTYGELGVLAHGLADADRDILLKALQTDRPLGCLEYVEGYDTVLFIFKERTSPELVERWTAALDSAADGQAKTASIRKVPVVYDGPDLVDVAKESGLTVDEVVDIHSSSFYTVRMMGFTPGFPYLDGLDERLHLPRRESPRNRIEPGSIAIGGSHAGIYSVASPGGWHLLGRTDLRLFSPDLAKGKSPPASEVFLLSPGDQIRFQPVD